MATLALDDLSRPERHNALCGAHSAADARLTVMAQTLAKHWLTHRENVGHVLAGLLDEVVLAAHNRELTRNELEKFWRESHG